MSQAGNETVLNVLDSHSPPLTRQLELTGCSGFWQNLRLALRQAGVADAPLPDLLESSVAGECVQCGIRLTTEDLLALSASDPADDAAHPKVARLRQGYCARNGCASYAYLLTFNAHPGVDWPKILAAVESAGQEQHAEVAAEAEAQQIGRREARKKRMLKLVAGIALLLLLLLIRQWITGGPIPILREPKEYTVDPASTVERPAP